MPLWRAVMDATEHVDSDSELSDADLEWFDQMYELVYMASEGRVSREEKAFGLLGSEELRRMLREKGLDKIGAQPA